MIRNPKYVYGPQSVLVPANINFGDYVLEKMWPFRQNVCMINGATDEQLTYNDIIHLYWGAVVGVACSGAILTTINTGYVKDELIHVTNISKPKYFIISPSMYEAHAKTIRSQKFVKKIILFGNEKKQNTLSFDDMALEKNGLIRNVKYEEFQSVEVQGQTDTLFIMYSSGTTGLPKGVMTTHLNVITACGLPASHDATKVSLTISPWYHVMGLVGTLTALVTGRTAVYIPKFSVDVYLRSIEKYQVVQLTVVPPVLVAVCKNKSKYDLSSVRMIYSGAAPLHKDTIQDVKATFPNVQGVYQGYGATELTLAVLRYQFNDPVNKLGSVGVVSPNTILKVVDIETREPLGPNQRGELCAKGELLMKGYVNIGRGSDFDDEGFYKTGDIAYYDDDGYFFIVDRLKELIKYKGFQVPPAEIEAVLLHHESIKEAAVIGIENRAAGEVPLAFVVVQPGSTLSEKEVQDFVAERLSNPKHLRGGVRFVDQIPKSPAGKLLRKDLRKMLNTMKSKL